MADLMVSYAREDADFVRALVAALASNGCTSWVDWTGLLPAAPVRQEIFDAIGEASAVVFVLTPHWIESTYCRQEFDHALHLRKRLLPVLLAPVDDTKVPPQLADVNWIRFDQLSFDDGLIALLRAFRLDLDRVRLHTRLLRRADTWQQRKDDSILLRGSELTEAERWLATAQSGEGVPTSLHVQFIAASRAAETSRQRRQLIAVSATLALTTVLAISAFLLYRSAETRRRTGQSRLLASEALARREQRLDEALLLAAHAYQIDPTVEARSALEQLFTTHDGLDRTLHGARGGVEGLATSADGRFAAGGDSTGQVLLWNLDTGQLVAKAAALEENDIVNDVKFAPDATEIAAGSMSGVVRILAIEPDGLLERRRWKAAAPVQSLAYAPDGGQLAVGDILGTVQILPAHTLDVPSQTLAVQTQAPALALAYHPDGSRLAIGRGDQRISVHDLGASNRVVHLEQHGRIAALAFLAAGTELVAAGDQKVRRWRLVSPDDHPEEFMVPHRILALAPVADGERLALGLDNGDVEVRAATGATGRVLSGHGGQLRSLAVAGGHLVAGSRSGRVLVWNVSADSQVAVATSAHSDDPGALTFSPSGGLLASGDYGGRLALWDRDRGGVSIVPLSDQVEDIDAIAFSLDGLRIAVASEASGLVVWNVPKGHVERPKDETLAGLVRLAYGEHPSLLIGVLADATVVRVDLDRRQTVRQAPPQPIGRPMCATLDAARRRFAFGTNDGYVAIVDVRTARYSRMPVRIQPGEVVGLAFTEDARLVGALTDGTLFEWRPGGERPLRLTGSGLSRLTALALSPRLGIAAVGDADGRILLWDTRAWQRIGEPRAVHRQGVSELAFDGDGTTLASNSGDGQIAIRRVDPEAWAAVACRQANRLLAQERADFDLGDVPECLGTVTPWPWRSPTLPPGFRPVDPREIAPTDGRIVSD